MKSFVFDLDGTLIESSHDFEWLYRAIREGAELAGYSDEVQNLSDRQLGKLAGIDGFHDYMRVCEQIGADHRKIWPYIAHCRAREKIREVMEGNLGERPGASETLEELREHGAKVGLVSNGPDESVDAVVRYFEWDRMLHFFRGVTDLEDMTRRKPDPWHLEMARAELHEDSVVYVGDSVVDVKAAKNADMDAVLVSSGERGITDLTELIDLVD